VDSSRLGVPFAFGLICLTGCADPMSKAQQQAKDYCASQGKEAIILDSRRSESFWTGELATVQTVCINPHNLRYTSASFGALLLANADIRGAQILQVRHGSIAERAGLRHADVVVEYAGRSIETAEALQTAISYTAAGARVPIKLHRGQEETDLTAQFLQVRTRSAGLVG